MLDPDVSLWLLVALSAAAAWAVVATIGWMRARARAAQPLARTAEQTLSHEIRTPLALVAGAADLLSEETPGPLTPQQRTFVDTITRNTQVVVDMAEGMLLELRVRRGDLALDVEPIDVRELVGDAVRELRRVRGLDVALDDRGAPLVVHADRRMVRQVLWNLVDNAVQHAGDDARVSVRVRQGDEGAIVSVSDDGSGMTLAQRRTLFTREPGAASERPGAGIGMAITQRIVEAHGGRLVVDTLADRGTDLVVVLPWAPTGARRR